MNRRIGLIALAVVLALIGTIAVYSYAHNADQRAISKTRSATVLYATKQIPAGTTWSDVLKGDYVAQEKLPVESAPSTALQNDNASIPLSQVAAGDVPAGQVVIREMFGERQVATGPLAIPKGQQAVSVAVPANADAGAYVQPGSEVAVYVTSKVTKLGGSPNTTGVGGGTDVYVTKLLLPRVSVLATSQGAPTDLTGAQSATSTNTTDTIRLTLALDERDAQRVILGQQIGQLYVALLTSSSVSETDGGTINVIRTKPTPIFVR